MSDLAKNPLPPQHGALNAIGGAALGGYIALLLGLSSTPVVASTLTVLLGAAAVFLALNDQLPGGSPREMTEAVLYRVIGFSLAGVVGLLCGLFLRASDAFGVSPNVQLYEDLVTIGVAEKTARELVLEQLVASEPRQENAADRSRRSTTLFSTGSSAPTCAELDPTKFTNAESVLARYQFEGGEWTKIASTVRAAVEGDASTDAMALLIALYTVHCVEKG